jgi:hypothetical protein
MTEDMKQNDATRYVVVNITGEFKIESVENNEAAAKKKAEALAAENEGTEYAVFQKIGSAKLDPRVVWKGASR